MASNNNNNNSYVEKSAGYALNQFKTEIANELGIHNYDQLDKGQLTSRQNGYVGGNMTKKMVAFAEQAMANGQVNAVANSAKTDAIR